MNAKGTKKEPKRRIVVSVSQHLGSRLDRLAKEYATRQLPGASLGPSDALRAALHVGIEAEEKRLGLPPLEAASNQPTPQGVRTRKRRARSRARPEAKAGR